MSRVTPATVIVLVVIGAAAGWLVEFLLTQNARPLLTPPLTFSFVLTALAAGVIVAALPVRRVARGRPGARVDPFLAARVAVFAQAASLTAGVLLGAMLAVLVFVVTRPVVGEGLLWPTILGTLAAVVLLAAGLVAEQMCRIPPGDAPRDDVFEEEPNV